MRERLGAKQHEAVGWKAILLQAKLVDISKVVGSNSVIIQLVTGVRKVLFL